MPRGGDQPLSSFEEALGLKKGFSMSASGIDPRKRHADAAIAWLKAKRPPRQSAWPALCLALVAQTSEALRLLELEYHENILAHRARLVAGRQLVLRVEKTDIPTRRYYNFAEQVIRVEMNRDHPSMPGHATAGWEAYSELIRHLGSCSSAGRASVAVWIWTNGVLSLTERLVPTQRTRRPRPFYEIVKDLDTASGQTGGALYQAMVYAYFVADSPTLTVVSHPVNTGSSRAGVIGDVDGFLGEEIVLAAEAKDKDLTIDDEDDLVAFKEDVGPHPDIDAVIFARTFDAKLHEILKRADIRTMSRQEMLVSVSLWDVPKQENAVRAMRFFLAHIQKSQKLLDRLVFFLEKIRPSK